jgi:predicted HicB family RNase H-like nuclease
MKKRSSSSVKKETTSIRIDPELWHEAKKRALDARKSIGEYIESLIEKDMKRNKN